MQAEPNKAMRRLRAEAAAAESGIAALSAPERDQLYNRMTEHLANEHDRSWLGCPACGRDTDLAQAVRTFYGLAANTTPAAEA